MFDSLKMVSDYRGCKADLGDFLREKEKVPDIRAKMLELGDLRF